MSEDQDKMKEENDIDNEEASQKEKEAQVSEEVSIARAELESLQASVKELGDMKDQMLRKAADFENAKKRLEREKDDYVKFAQERLLGDILPILDNFERALSHSKEIEGNQMKGMVKGIEMVFKQFFDVLKNQGLTRLDVVGKPFDPHHHEAIAHVQEEGPEDVVIDEIEAGYMLHDRLLRAAKVRVRVAPSKEEETSDKE